MDKNWLIRMQDCQILGPVTKENVLELIENGTLTGEDEISSGNGYWFWVKEQELLEKYLHGTEVQPFNPVNSFEGRRGHYEEGTLPGRKDLEYPDGGEWTSSEDSSSRMAEQGEVGSSDEIVMDEDASDKAIEEETSSEINITSEGISKEGETSGKVAREEDSADVESLLANVEFSSEDDDEAQRLVENDLEYPDRRDERKHSSDKRPPSKKVPSRNSGEWVSFLKTFFITILVVVVLLIVCEKVFQYPVLQWIFPAAGAQETLSQDASGTGLQHLSVERGWEGFVISAKESALSQDCERAKSYLVGVFMLLDKRAGRGERWKPFVKQCSSAIPTDVQAMLNVSRNSNGQQLRNHFKVWGLSSKEWGWASKIYRSVARQRNDASIVGEFLVHDGLKKKIFLSTGIFWILHNNLNPNGSGMS